MNSAVANYLRSPELVAKVQTLFGIKLLEYKSNRKVEDHKNNENLTRRSSKNGKTDDAQDYENSSDSETEKKYIVTNKFWYYLFIVGTELGDEIFYATFIPFWFWNVDSVVGRKVVFIWAAVMYVGQALKDVVRENRPGPPSQKLQEKWANEFGLPSTHACAALSIPLSIVLFTMNKYAYDFYIGIIITIIWLLLISLSRVYLGMHTVLDIVTGVLLTIILMVPLVPLQYYSDYFLVTNNFSPLIVVLVPVFLMIIYPNADRFTPTRGDTCCIVSVFVGCYLGAWLNKQVGLMNVERIPSDGLLEIGWPTWTEFGLILLRTLLGLFCVALVEFVGKFFFFSIISFILRKNPKELKKSDDSLENKPKIIADLFTKFLTYTSIGIFVQFVVPLIFSEIGINRQAFYSEI